MVKQSDADFISRLKKGIFLDDDEVLIPWLTPLESLHQYGNPYIISEQKTPSGLVTRKTPYSIFLWQNKSWCDFKCNIETTLYKKDSIQLKDSTQDYDWYYSYVVRHFYIHTVDDSLSTQKEFYELENIFTQYIGGPLYKEDRIIFGRKYPFVKWAIGNIELSIAMQERFVDFNTILVKYT